MNTKLATAQIRVQNWTANNPGPTTNSGLSVKDYCAAKSYFKRLLITIGSEKLKQTLLYEESGFVEINAAGLQPGCC